MMTKEAITARLIDRLIDPCSGRDETEDLACSAPIDLDGARSFLADLRADDDDADMPEDERVPEETTPELLMEVYNCLIRKAQHTLDVQNLAQYITDNEMVCEYDQYRGEFYAEDTDVFPVDSLFNMYHMHDVPFRIGSCAPDVADLIRIGQNSTGTLNLGEQEYYWFDMAHFRLCGTSHPFADGLLDARHFAEYILGPDGKECLNYLLDGCIPDEDVKDVFGCTRQEVRARYFLS